MKTVDTKGYLSALCDIAQNGEVVSTVVSGGSMTPFLGSNRDYVYLEVPKKEPKKGDIVLFLRAGGDYVLHRIKRVTKEGYYMIGDRQTVLEGPIKREQIKLLAVMVKRKGKLLYPQNIKWKFYSKIWNNLVFLRPFAFSLIKFCKKKKSDTNK